MKTLGNIALPLPTASERVSALFLKTLQLTHFKNYTQHRVELSPRLNGFAGPNGTGKTNLLEAVHVLCLTRSHHRLSDKYLVEHGADFYRLEGYFERNGETEHIVVKYDGQRKEVERNGSPFPRLMDYIGRFPVVMISPDDISLVQEGSEERRRFLDATLSQLSLVYLSQLTIYTSLLKQRNALLRAFAEQRRFDALLLETFDRQMAGPAAALWQMRSAFVEQLAPLFQEIYAEIAGTRESVALGLERGGDSDDLAAELVAYRERDRALERTSVGPHRDDLSLTLNGYSIRKYASQGQLKSFLLALRLAQYEVLRQVKGTAPLLLLDDLFDKLDEQRVQQLIALLWMRQFGQIFITDTHPQRLESVVKAFGTEYRIYTLGENASGSGVPGH